MTALRYDYEYLEDGHLSDEAINVSRVQEGAVKFASDFDKSINSELIGSDSKVFYGNMHEVGANPINRNIKQFGTFRFLIVVIKFNWHILENCLHIVCIVVC